MTNLEINKYIKQHFNTKYWLGKSNHNTTVRTLASWWMSPVYNRTTWVTCRFHLAGWPSCHISKDIGAGLAKWYGWVMGCRPHPDTLGRWGAAAKPQSLLTSPSCAFSKFADDTPWATLPSSDICQPFLFFCNSVTWLHAVNMRPQRRKIVQEKTSSTVCQPFNYTDEKTNKQKPEKKPSVPPHSALMPTYVPLLFSPFFSIWWAEFGSHSGAGRHKKAPLAHCWFKVLAEQILGRELRAKSWPFCSLLSSANFFLGLSESIKELPECSHQSFNYSW